jgi:hypothetical protein
MQTSATSIGNTSIHPGAQLGSIAVRASVYCVAIPWITGTSRLERLA